MAGSSSPSPSPSPSPPPPPPPVPAAVPPPPVPAVVRLAPPGSQLVERPSNNNHRKVYTEYQNGNCQFDRSTDMIWKLLANEDKQNTDATYNALSFNHNPHMRMQPNGTVVHPHVTDPYPSANPRGNWTRICRLTDRTSAPNAPLTLQALLDMTLADWFRFADYMGWDWRGFRHGPQGRFMTVPFARAKYCVKIGVFHRIPLQHFYQRPISIVQSRTEAQAAIAQAGPREALYPWLTNDHNNQMNWFWN
ncbi:hypothetical protein BJ508DRAFT_313485 [Ascobolus immersus RN42]|uniref:Uncharacterized protein n=1 Tax=Ascobolus immersus RN42 TaxID=1160509 RepID=A0A3N4HMN4_ASCIM|nr:hypothetical protein BJ508DRAFT_313485 [Ascobolus immersus RN42]